MPEIPDKCEFVIGRDQAKLETQTNGDVLTVRGINLSPEQAGTLAYLLNIDTNLHIEIKAET